MVALIALILGVALIILCVPLGISVARPAKNVSPLTKIVWSSLPFVLIGAIFISMPRIKEWNAAKILENLETGPLQSSITKEEGAEIRGKRVTFSEGPYGIVDIGNLRLVFDDLSFTGRSSGTITLGTKSTSTGSGGSTGVGNRKFETTGIPGGTRCTFGGITFDIVNGVLELDGDKIDAMGPPTLILIGKDQKIIRKKPMTLD